MRPLGKESSLSETARWRELGSPDDVADALIDLFEQRGGDRYDEVITQTEHALQSGALAMAAGADASTITAAFLHDIGHLLANGHDRERDLRHEAVGARFLAGWFTPAVTDPIRLHVAAKRYLCATSPDYHGDLSPASVASLVLQGGPMSEAEVAEFEREPLAGTAVDLRRWDDLAKVLDASTPGLHDFRDLMIDLITV
jgi:phosphonate degradation associated HDIG domain protein